MWILPRREQSQNTFYRKSELTHNNLTPWFLIGRVHPFWKVPKKYITFFAFHCVENNTVFFSFGCGENEIIFCKIRQLHILHTSDRRCVRLLQISKIHVFKNAALFSNIEAQPLKIETVKISFSRTFIKCWNVCHFGKLIFKKRGTVAFVWKHILQKCWTVG